MNPKYGILTVKGYLQKARFAPDTTIEPGPGRRWASTE